MLHLMRSIDRATGYVYVPPSDANPPPDTIIDPNASRSEKPNMYALFTTAAGELSGPRSDVRDVQERWIDAKDEWDAFERKQWRQEGEAVRDQRAQAESANRNIRMRG